MKLLFMCCLLIGQLDEHLAARILAVLPMPSKSHYMVTSSVLKALAARGHDVTVYSPYPPTVAVKNMKHIEIHTEFEELMQKSFTFETFKELTGARSYWGLTGAPIVWNFGYPICEQVFEHPKIVELMASGQKFEIFITEALFGQESVLALGHLFKAITIDINTFGLWSVLNRVHGNALQVPYVTESPSLDFTDHMSFMERLRNLVSVTATLAMYNFHHLPKHQAIIDRALNGKKFPPVADMVGNISVTISNFHATVGYPRSIPPSIIPVGGIHIHQELQPLPKDVKEFMDSGKNSVIYFSLGSVVPTHLMPQEYINLFVKTFSKLPYKILWKLEGDNILNLPKNVMISKWLPQQSVLAHPNCVLFITHGGLLSQQEAFHFGVPVVGIPFFGDQPYNVRLYEHLGVGVLLDFNSITEQTFTKAILSVVGKPQYVEKAKQLSTMFRHQIMSPADTAVFWVEYALRHNSAAHLHPRAATMPLYQLALLDILAVIMFSFISLYFLLKTILTAICCRQKKLIVESKKKKKTN